MKLRSVLLVIGLLGFAIVIILSRHQLTLFVQLFKSLRPWVIALIVIVQLASYYLNACYYQSILRIFGYHVATSRLFGGALATNFVNYIIPSAGMAGAGYLSQVLSPDVPRGEAVLTQLVRYALSGLAVLLALLVGATLLRLNHPHGASSITPVALLAATAITLLALATVIVARSESYMSRLASRLSSWLRSHFHHLRRAQLEPFVADLYLGVRQLTRYKQRLLVPFLWSLGYIIVEIATLNLTFLAFDHRASPGVVIMSYALANIASLIGGTFFNVGIFELGMAGTLVALGEPIGFAISVTTVYRILNLVTGLPPGFYFYRKYLPKDTAKVSPPVV